LTSGCADYRNHQANTLSAAMNMNQSVQLSWVRDMMGRLMGAGGGGKLGLAISSDAEMVVVTGTLGGAA
jgi:hypothetical protein